MRYAALTQSLRCFNTGPATEHYPSEWYARRRDGVSLGSDFERFLELPVLVMIVALWLVGVVLLGGCALVPYFLWAVLA